MKLFIDDERDPMKYLGPERGHGVVWVKEWWEAKNILKGNQTELTEIHFDHYLGGRHTAGELFEHVAYRLTSGSSYQKLKDIYLHSSDLAIVERYIERWSEKLAAVGVTLHNNSRG